MTPGASGGRPDSRQGPGEVRVGGTMGCEQSHDRTDSAVSMATGSQSRGRGGGLRTLGKLSSHNIDF